MVVISVYIYGVKIIKKFQWESGFLKGGSMEPPYALTEVRGTLYAVNPNLPDPLNFVPFGTMRYSPFDISLISITCILFVYLYFCLFLSKA